MGCTSCAARAAALANGSFGASSTPITEQGYGPEDCDYTKEILTKWYDALLCVSLNNKSSFIGLVNKQIN